MASQWAVKLKNMNIFMVTAPTFLQAVEAAKQLAIARGFKEEDVAGVTYLAY